MNTRLFAAAAPSLKNAAVPTAISSASGIAVMFGAYGQTSTLSGLATLPEILWEGAVLGVYLIVKGFKPSRITSERVQPLAVEAAFSLR